MTELGLSRATRCQPMGARRSAPRRHTQSPLPSVFMPVSMNRFVNRSRTKSFRETVTHCLTLNEPVQSNELSYDETTLSLVQREEKKKYTLSCGCEITGISIVVHHWVCQGTKCLGIDSPQHHEATMVSQVRGRDKPLWFSDQHSQTDVCYMLLPPCPETNLPESKQKSIQL